MKRLSIVSFAVLLVVMLSMSCAGHAGASSAVPSLSNSLAEGNTEFAVPLYLELGAAKGNLFFSPYSISSALGMTYAGAGGDTAAQMKEVLRFRLNQAELNSAFKALNGELRSTAQKTGQKLSIANALILTGGPVSSGFKAMLKESYDAEIFGGGLDKVNGWVKEKTEGKIDKILSELSPDSVCVLLNAIYFKGVWDVQFDKKKTVDAPFKVSADRQVTVPLMHRKDDMRIMTGKDFQAVSIPYKGESMSMVILLPKAVDGLPALERQLTAGNLREWLAELDKKPVRKTYLYLPKFKLETGYDLKAPFQAMGMKDAFSTTKADFTGMGWEKGSLWIGQIKHKAFVEVNEEGTEAAAATAVEMVTKSAPVRDHEVFRADHPFLFMVRDNASGAILFMGRMADPGKR